MRPTILALDFEGTLISNAVSQIPRPGLTFFLDQMQSRFNGLVMFTTVDDFTFRSIARTLVGEGHAPTWFSSLKFTRWSGPTKDLTIVAPVLGDALLLDDYRGYVHPGQEQWWIEAPPFCHPYPETDQGLVTVANKIDQRLSSYS